ncbi:hypothetical protein HGO75_23970 [Mycobacterium tuberculosis]|nr:hypothetical protein [Mycobacterium tuberculosis]
MGEVASAVALVNRQSIKNQAATMGIYKGRPPFAVTKDPVLNAIRLRCRKMMITLRDLDWHLQTHVFKLSGHTKVRIKPYWLLKAIRFLGGRFTPDGQVVWV